MKQASVYIVACSFLMMIAAYGGDCQAADAQTAQENTVASAGDFLKAGIRDFKEGSYEEAEQNLVKARVENPSSSQAAYYLGKTLKKMQNYPDALKHLKDSVTLQPAVPEGFLELADTYYALDKNDEAFAALEVASTQNIEPAQTAYLKGLVLLRKRKFQDAIAAFSAAKSSDPKLTTSADYQTGVAYVGMGKREQAIEQFKAIVAREPESEFGQLAAEQTKALEAAAKAVDLRFHAAASLQVQYDSNVVLKPNDVATEVSGKGGFSTVVNAQADYKLVNKAETDLKLQYALYWNKQFDSNLSDFDVQSHVLGAENNYQLGGGKLLGVLANYNYTLVHGDKYQTTITLSPTYSFIPAGNQRLLFSLLYQKKNYEVISNGTGTVAAPVFPDENRNGSNVGAGVAWTTPIQQGSLILRYDLNHEDTEGANWSYLGNKLSAGIQRAITEKLRVAGNLDFTLQSFDNANTSFQNKKRSDKIYTIGAQALYSIGKNIDAQLFTTYVKNDSTLDVYNFDKYIMGLGVQAAF